MINNVFLLFIPCFAFLLLLFCLACHYPYYVIITLLLIFMTSKLFLTVISHQENAPKALLSAGHSFTQIYSFSYSEKTVSKVQPVTGGLPWSDLYRLFISSPIFPCAGTNSRHHRLHSIAQTMLSYKKAFYILFIGPSFKFQSKYNILVKFSRTFSSL